MENEKRIKQLKRLKTTLQAVLELRNESEKQDKKVEAEQIETSRMPRRINPRREAMLARRTNPRRETMLARKKRTMIPTNNHRKAELIKLRNDIMACEYNIDKQERLSQLKELEKQSYGLSETEFQKRLSKLKPTIIILYER